MGEFSAWHILIIAAVFVLLFGYKKLPDATRSIGRSLRIFKAETRGLREDGDSEHPRAVEAAPVASAAPAASPAPAPTTASAPATAPASVSERQRDTAESPHS